MGQEAGLASPIIFKPDVVYIICTWTEKGSNQANRAGTDTLMGDLWKCWKIIFVAMEGGMCIFTTQSYPKDD